ncbi:molybdenum cofactor synthesis domain-containing protein [Carboxylicivirga caseinilyticus]|uniref:molybdenum cofactor synthesis domain-containing protein n=1 Tax=Carboxylicivirga caseinilyticus TaxID=3417572 RepID=UPI003D33B9F8|nr:hypothetical protein [Marinilabiliaceae bacterium A049]
MKIEVLAVNISEKKGTIKKPQAFITLNENGVEGDAHSGPWHRQVSLLAIESIEKFAKEAGREIKHGEFAENITTKGIELHYLRPFDRLKGDDVELEVTQIGKKCHGSNCNIFKEVGNCVMPKEGIFARVIKGSQLKSGDELILIPKVFRVLVITMSDRAFHGVYDDKSGPMVQKLTKDYFEQERYPVEVTNEILPDDSVRLESILREAVDQGVEAVFITGGTGIGPKDITPETVKKVIDKEIPGIMELVRYKYGQNIPGALLSRSIAGVASKTLIYAIPGSPKAAKEYVDEIYKTFMHSIRMIEGIDMH